MNTACATRLVLALVVAVVAPMAAAQYKIVDSNGRVTYTDRPAPAAADKVQPLRATGGAAEANANLPFELRQIAERYPVTLYTGEACEPCIQGRLMLTQRGVPFTEKTIRTDADIAAFKSTEASGELPVLRIGGQQLKGYKEDDWRGYLDAAGYPKQSRLTASYKPPEATPMVAIKPAPASQARPAVTAAPVPSALPPVPERAPNGIRF